MLFRMQSGSLADWLTGIGTVGSLYLGFTILMRDRRKADQAEATQVVAWFVNQKDGTTELSINNGAGRPIVHVTFCLASVDKQGKAAALWRILNIAPVLGPGEVGALSLPFSEFHANGSYPSYIQFRDANGLSWRRNVRSGELRRTKVGLSWRQRLKLARSPSKAIALLKVRYRRW
jgi:hypothetical protein